LVHDSQVENYCRYMKDIDRVVAGVMRDQMSLVTRGQARSAGMSDREIRHRVTTGQWVPVHPSVYRASSAGRSHQRDLLAACLAGPPQAVASHQSAAWMLRLSGPPDRPVITVPNGCAAHLRGVTVHRSRDLDAGRILVRNGIPYTDALRVLTDMAGLLQPGDLSLLVDTALGRRLVTADGLMAEIDRRTRRGRRGPARLGRVLTSRGFVGAPEPSVLEAMALRLFQRWLIPVLQCEVHVDSNRRYRVDFLIAPALVVEVDGFAYHWSPEDKAYDDARRNRLRAAGLTVLVYDWRAVRFDERRLATEVRAALSRLAT
jgi:Transcriptional regulator, AbiEi antitoxin/Protein of unknown function (DUF559)